MKADSFAAEKCLQQVKNSTSNSLRGSGGSDPGLELIVEKQKVFLDEIDQDVFGFAAPVI